MRVTAQLKYILLSVLFIIASVNITRTTLEILKSSQRLESLKNEVSELEKDKAVLENNIAYKKTEEYVEEKARNDLNMIKPGEKIYVVEGFENNLGIPDKDGSNVLSANIVNKDSKAGAGKASDDTSKKNTNPFQWYRLFFE
jgi:cell division protein DivIC